jgi:hypothetical protein
MIIIGIDPGKNGAIIELSDTGVRARYTMPLIGNEFDIQALHQILCWFKNNGAHHIFIEDVHAIFGSAAKATFSFGFVCGAIQGVVVACGIPFTVVQPKIWQKEVYQGIPEIRKPPIIIKKGKRTGQTIQGKRDCKKMSELAAKRLFPTVDLRKNEACKISHDGIVDALLIAEYGRRILK